MSLHETRPQSANVGGLSPFVPVRLNLFSALHFHPVGNYDTNGNYPTATP